MRKIRANLYTVFLPNMLKDTTIKMPWMLDSSLGSIGLMRKTYKSSPDSTVHTTEPAFGICWVDYSQRLPIYPSCMRE